MTREPRLRRDEAGTSLIIALIFVVATALILLTLVGLTGTNLINTANLQNDRSTAYSADSIADGAIQVVRGGTTSCSSTSAVFAPASGINGQALKAFCNVTGNPTGSRIVQFYVCPSSDGTYSACSTDDVLAANITFIDENCPTIITCTASTGYAVQINSWVVTRANV